MAENWRGKVDPAIRGYLEMQVKEVARHKGAYKLSQQPGNAQLWIALANLSKQIFDINLKLNYLERALRDIGGRKQDESSLGKTSEKTKTSEKAEKTKKLVKSLKKM